MNIDPRDIPDEDLEELYWQAGEILAEQASGFGYSERTTSWAKTIQGEYGRRYRLRATIAQGRINLDRALGLRPQLSPELGDDAPF